MVQAIQRVCSEVTRRGSSDALFHFPCNWGMQRVDDCVAVRYYSSTYQKRDVMSYRIFGVRKGKPCTSITCSHFLRYTFSPTFSSRFGIVTFPSVEAIMVVFPEAEGPNSLD